MKIKSFWRNGSSLLPAFVLLALCGNTALATSITADLTCVFVGANNVSCPASPATSYGSVMLEDFASGSSHFGQIKVTVDLANAGMKFRDMMLNFNPLGSGISSISSSDGQVSLVPDSFSIPPYSIGLFDVGSTGNQGWKGGSSYTAYLTGSGVGGTGVLTLAMFDQLDTSGLLNVALHLQNVVGLADGDSIKIGGDWDGGGGGGGGELVPEPVSVALVGSGMILLAWGLRRRRVS